MDTEKQNDSAVEKNDNKTECRACLRIFDLEESLVNLFQAWVPPWDGMGPTIAEDLSKIANIQVLETDRHSKVICETCCQKLREACEFTTLVFNNNILLTQRYPEDTEEDKVWPKPIQLDLNVNGTIFENNMNIDIKQEILSDDEYGNTNGMEADYLDLEIKIEPEEFIEQKPIRIAAVNGAFMPQNKLIGEDSPSLTNGNNDLHEHSLDVTIKEEPLSEDEATDPPADLPLECMLCTKSFNSVSGLKSHVIAQHSYKTVKRKSDGKASPLKTNNAHICNTCRRSFTTSTDLLVHQTCHNQYTCYGCFDKFDTFPLLAEHRLHCIQSNGSTVKHKSLDDVKRPKVRRSKSIEGEAHKCTECNQEFSDSYYLSVHMEIHGSSDANVVKTEEPDVKPTAMDIEALEDIFTDST